MPAFHDVRFPTDIAYGSAGGPEFSTEVVQLGNGNELRNQNWTYPRERWNVAYGVKSKTNLQALMNFFYARKGRLHAFRFKNHDDFSVTNQELGTGDGSTTTFQLVRHYGTTYDYERKILKPVSGTVKVYLDSVEQTEGGDWAVDLATGIVTMTAAPTTGEVVTADFDFDIPVRFDTDFLPLNLDTYLARSAQVPIVELKNA